MNEQKAIEVFCSLPRLTEISIDGNPIAAKIGFKYEMIVRMGERLEMLDEEAVQELDRDVALQYYQEKRSILLLF